MLAAWNEILTREQWGFFMLVNGAITLLLFVIVVREWRRLRRTGVRVKASE